MTLGEAMAELKAGKRVQRPGWNVAHHPQYGSGQSMWAAEHEGEPWLFVAKGISGPYVKWTPGDTDKAATDWQVAQ